MKNTNQAAEPKKKNKVVSIIVDVILVLAIVFAVFASYSAYVATQGNDLPGLFGLKMASVQSDSMNPTFAKGDMVFCTAVKDPSKLEVGDIITFRTVINGEQAVNTHRIESISDGGTYRIFTTKGDNNTIADSLTVHENSIIGRYRFHLPKLGSAFDFLKTSTGFLVVIVVPVAIFFLWQLIQFFIALFAYQAEKVRQQYAAQMGQPAGVAEASAEPEKTSEPAQGDGKADAEAPTPEQKE